MKRFLITLSALVAALFPLQAQQYTGLEGLLHCPSADMHAKGTGRISLAALDRNSMPENYRTDITAYSLAYSPFDWAELSFTGLVRNIGGTIYQDRMASVKLRVIEENKWWPSLSVGSNDPLSTIRTDAESEENNMMCNVYVSLSKHIPTKVGTIGLHTGYRRFKKTVNCGWNGIVGGLTYSPSILPAARMTGEYDGAGFNLGGEIEILKHFNLQAIWYGMRWFNCGICFEANL